MGRVQDCYQGLRVLIRLLVNFNSNCLHKMSYEYINNENLEQPEKNKVEHFVWQYFAVTNNTDARKGCTKNAVCIFLWHALFVTKASVDWHLVLAQEKAGICPCIAIYYDRLRTVQKTIFEMMCGEEQRMETTSDGQASCISLKTTSWIFCNIIEVRIQRTEYKDSIFLLEELHFFQCCWLGFIKLCMHHRREHEIC